MPLLNDDLTVWEIAFRWAGLDPDCYWVRLPLPVRDNARLLLDAILNAHLFCISLSLDKWKPDSDDEPQFFIRHHLEGVEACIAGQTYPRKLLRWAVIDRWDMLSWCERQGIPLPEFWFPPGWKLAYEWPEDAAKTQAIETAPINVVVEQGAPISQPPASAPQEAEQGNDAKLRPIQQQRIACQYVAARIWEREGKLSIKEMAYRPEIQEVCGGSERDLDVVVRWLGEVDPRDPSQKRGRKRRQ